MSDPRRCLSARSSLPYRQRVPQLARWQVGTLARRYLVRPGRLYLYASTLIIQLDPVRGAEALEPFIQQLNARRLAIPWLFGLILRVEIAPQP